MEIVYQPIHSLEQYISIISNLVPELTPKPGLNVKSAPAEKTTSLLA